MQPRIAVINYNVGNIQSVYNAFHFLGFSVFIANQPQQLLEASHIVLPGVVAFGDGIKNLQAGSWVPALNEAVLTQKKPFLGLCLGMQLLASNGYEFGKYEGLNWIAGDVSRLDAHNTDIRIPHIGWDDVEVINTNKLFDKIDKKIFYFAHSYVLRPKNETIITATCNYGEKFTASIQQENIFGAQFHPEKSQKAGLALLKNFAEVTYA